MDKTIIFKALTLRHEDKLGVKPKITSMAYGLPAINSEFSYLDDNDESMTVHKVTIQELLQFMYTQGYLDRANYIDPQFPEYG